MVRGRGVAADEGLSRGDAVVPGRRLCSFWLC